MKLGVAITSYNEKEHIARCLASCVHQADLVVVVENGGEDGTTEMIAARFKDVIVLNGHHDIWWAEGTNIAMKKCLAEGCTHILVLNADMELHEACVQELARRSAPDTIVAALVLDRNDTCSVWWAGGCWGKRWKYLPIYGMQPIVKRKSPISCVRPTCYASDDFHGRGVLISAEVFRQCGWYDSQIFPHYGSDTDFALRVKKHGFKVLVNPHACAYVDTARTFLPQKRRSLLGKIHNIYRLFFDLHSRYSLIVSWRLFNRHLPRRAAVPTFVYTAMAPIVKWIF